MNTLRFPRTSAVMGEGTHSREIAHLGEPLREQRRLSMGKAVADLSATRILRLTGPDRLTWLNSITTQKIDDLAAGTSTETLVLSPTGHIEFWLRLHEDGEALWVLSELDTDGAQDFLLKMRFMMRVEIEDVSDTFQAIGVIGEPPRSLPAALVWNDPWPHIGAGSASYAHLDAGMPVASPDHPGTDVDLRIVVAPSTDLADWDPAAAGVEVAGRDAWDALRIEAWRPGAADVDHKALVGELDVLRTAVHLSKGCYRGQEAVARVHNLGQTPRRLVFLHLDGSGHSLPSAGASVRAEVRGAEREVGTLTSVALHHELGPVALALVKRTLAEDAELTVDGPDGEERIAASAETVVVTARENRTRIPGRNRETDMRAR
ncbi:YgfZ/GcvT domain-containing protein [Brevibacterium litoralis]|uniref:CAF17-like 4Fe-4S cluster assembly/insertion protein YgfZ n=1 Tax=Brevibacterium litoralis TaxID=3138935 RepID=UPI0032ED20CC